MSSKIRWAEDFKYLLHFLSYAVFSILDLKQLPLCTIVFIKNKNRKPRVQDKVVIELGLKFLMLQSWRASRILSQVRETDQYRKAQRSRRPKLGKGY